MFSNLVAYKYKEGNKLIVECHAEHYLEPISSFLFCTQQDVNSISASLRNETMCKTSQKNDVQMMDAYVTNVISRSIEKGTLPGFPFSMEFESNNNTPFDIVQVMHEKSHDEFHAIPIINGKKLK